LVLQQKSVNIRQFLDQNGGRFPGSITGPGIDSDQGWRVARLTGLQARGKFE
jgi:hypothetical protein